MDSSFLCSLLVIGVIMLLIFSILYYTFDVISLFASFFLTWGIFMINPSIVEGNDAHYYTMIILVTLLFSMDAYRTNTKLVLLLIIAIGVTLISIYTKQKLITYFSIFLKIYLLAIVGKSIWSKITLEPIP
jgi:hypothetical protein